jgi:hypothetical protein
LIKAHPTATILFTGHSLGAALTTFAAIDVKERLPPKNKILIYNFGSPRTGNQAWSDYVMKLFPQGTFYRGVHGHDIVPHLPNHWQGFNHAGTEVWYPGRGLELVHQFCYNAIGKDENEGCSGTLGPLEISPEDHMIYVGIDLKAQWCAVSSFLQ